MEKYRQIVPDSSSIPSDMGIVGNLDLSVRCVDS